MRTKLFTIITVLFIGASTWAQTPTTDPGVVINGVKWATRNVDAIGTFADKPESSGMFYQWNRSKAWPATGNLSDWPNTSSDGVKWEPENDPCPAGWCVPTNTELQSLLEIAKVDRKWTTQNGVDGYKFTDKESGDSLFLPMLGYRYEGRLSDTNSYYWSSVVYSEMSAYNMQVKSTGVSVARYGYSHFGAFIRAVAQTPTNTRNTTLDCSAFTQDETGDGWAWSQTTRELSLSDIAVSVEGGSGILTTYKMTITGTSPVTIETTGNGIEDLAGYITLRGNIADITAGGDGIHSDGHVSIYGEIGNITAGGDGIILSQGFNLYEGAIGNITATGNGITCLNIGNYACSIGSGTTVGHIKGGENGYGFYGKRLSIYAPATFSGGKGAFNFEPRIASGLGVVWSKNPSGLPLETAEFDWTQAKYVKVEPIVTRTTGIVVYDNTKTGNERILNDTSGDGWTWERATRTLTLRNLTLTLSKFDSKAAIVVPDGSTIVGLGEVHITSKNESYSNLISATGTTEEEFEKTGLTLKGVFRELSCKSGTLIRTTTGTPLTIEAEVTMKDGYVVCNTGPINIADGYDLVLWKDGSGEAKPLEDFNSATAKYIQTKPTGYLAVGGVEYDWRIDHNYANWSWTRATKVLEVKGSIVAETGDGIHLPRVARMVGSSETAEISAPNGHGISTLGNLNLSGTFGNITAGKDGINTEGEIVIADGTVIGDITTGEDGIHALGNLIIEDGTVIGDITAAKKGINADGKITHCGTIGNINAQTGGMYGNNGINFGNIIYVGNISSMRGVVGNITTSKGNGIDTNDGSFWINGSIGDISAPAGMAIRANGAFIMQRNDANTIGNLTAYSRGISSNGVQIGGHIGNITVEGDPTSVVPYGGIISYLDKSYAVLITGSVGDIKSTKYGIYATSYGGGVWITKTGRVGSIEAPYAIYIRVANFESGSSIGAITSTKNHGIESGGETTTITVSTPVTVSTTSTDASHLAFNKPPIIGTGLEVDSWSKSATGLPLETGVIVWTEAKYVKITKEKTAVTIGGITTPDAKYTTFPYTPTGTVTVTNDIDPDKLVWLYESTDVGNYSSSTAPTNVGAYKLTIAVPLDNADYRGSFSSTFEITQARAQTLLTPLSDVTMTAYEARNATEDVDRRKFVNLPETITVTIENGEQIDMKAAWVWVDYWYIPNGRTYTWHLLALFDFNIDPSPINTTVKLIVTPVGAVNPTFEQAYVSTGSYDGSATVEDLVAAGVLPTNGYITVEGEAVAYTITWSGEPLNTGSAGNTADFAGTVYYPDLPYWMTSPRTFSVARTVGVKDIIISSRTPDTNAADVAIDAAVSVIFSGNISSADLSGIYFTPAVNNTSASITDNVLSIAHDDFANNTPYTVTIPAGTLNEYTDEISWTFTTVGTTGVSDINTDAISIYPNPTAGKLIIKNEKVKVGEVIIYDIQGKKLSIFDSQLSTLEIDLSAYAEGMYFVQVNGTIHKIIKQ